MVITAVPPFWARARRKHNTLVVLHKDKPGAIAAVTNFMAYSGVNIGSFRLARAQKGGTAVMTIEVDG